MSHQLAVWFGDGDGWTHGGQLGMSESPSPLFLFLLAFGVSKRKTLCFVLKTSPQWKSHPTPSSSLPPSLSHLPFDILQLSSLELSVDHLTGGKDKFGKRWHP